MSWRQLQTCLETSKEVCVWGKFCPGYYTPHKPTAGRYDLDFHFLYSQSPLVVIFDTLTAQRYIDDILPPVVLPFYFEHPGLNFQHDNVRLYTTRVCMNCLQVCSMRSWPNRSLDLSPIEHIWDVMRRWLQPFRNIDDLVQQLETIWHEILKDTIQ